MKLQVSNFFWLIAALSVSHTIYAVDENGDQISDVYAEHYGLAAGSGEENPDGDEHSNYIESVWGTDPFDSESVFKPTSAQVVASVFDFAIPTVAGKRYQFRGTPTLDAASWIDVDLPFNGTGAVEHMLTVLPISGTDKFFWTVRAVSPLDSDSDGLDAFEELLLGTLDTNADSDGDRVDDLAEFLAGLSPALNLDADSDGLPDDWELFHGAYNPSSDNDGDGWTNLEEFTDSEDPNKLNNEIAPPTLELLGDISTSGNLYTISDGGYLRICVRTLAGSGKTHYLVESPNLEPRLRFSGSSYYPVSSSGEPAAYDPEAKQVPVLKVKNGTYTIRAKSFLDDDGNLLESDEVQWTIRVRPYGTSGLPSGVRYVSTRAYYDPVTKLFHTSSFDVPQARRRFTSRGWLIEPTSSFQPDYEDFIPDLTASTTNVWMAYDGDGSYSTDFNSAYWGSATMVNLGTGWAAGDEFFIDFSHSSNRKRYYGDSKRGSISASTFDVIDLWEENLGYGWMTADGFVPDKTYVWAQDDIYYDDERGRLTTDRPQGIDSDEDLGQGWIGGWMSRFISEEYATDFDRDRVPDALERELGLSVYSPAGGEDSDGDGLMDFEEVQQGSDPSNANDTFASAGSFEATQETLIPVNFTVGDHSGSHSEQWELKIYNVTPSGEVLKSRVQAGLGVLASREISFPEGFRQRVELNHVQGQGDFDYTFEIEVAAAAPDGTGLVIDDPDSLLGVNDNVTPADLDGDVTITVPKVRLKAEQGESVVINLSSAARTPIYFEAAPLVGPGTFKLTQNNDKIKIWDSETGGSVLTQASSKTKSWSLTNSQLGTLNATNRIWVEGLEASDETYDTTITLQYHNTAGIEIGEAAEFTITNYDLNLSSTNAANSGGEQSFDETLDFEIPVRGNIVTAEETAALENALVIYYNEVVNASNQVAAFDIDFESSLPDTIWFNTGGRGELTNPTSNQAKLTIAAQSVIGGAVSGGLYSFTADLGEGSAFVPVRAWLPVAGPSIDATLLKKVDMINEWGAIYREYLMVTRVPYIKENQSDTFVNPFVPDAVAAIVIAGRDMAVLGKLLDWAASRELLKV